MLKEGRRQVVRAVGEDVGIHQQQEAAAVFSLLLGYSVILDCKETKPIEMERKYKRIYKTKEAQEGIFLSLLFFTR